MKNIFLIDASTYKTNIPESIINLKLEHYKIKCSQRLKLLGHHLSRGSYNYSLGLLNIAKIYLESGHNVHYFDFNYFSANLFSLIHEYLPDIVGFYAVTPTVPQCSLLSEKIKKYKNEIQIILGGPHAISAASLTRYRYPIFDEIIRKSKISDIKNILYLSSIKNQSSNLLPYNILPHSFDKYAHNLITSQGCRFKCLYCQDKHKDPEIIPFIDNLMFLIKNLPQKSQVHIADSSLGGSTKKAIDICKKLQKINHDLILSCDLHPNFMKTATINELIKAKIKEVRIGIDSFDEKVLLNNKRTLDLKKLKNLLYKIRSESDIYISIYLLTGLPGTDQETFAINKDGISELFERDLVNQIKHHLFVPYPQDNQLNINSSIIINVNDWSKYDRYSFPVYELQNYNADNIWFDYLNTEEHIIKTWKANINFDDKINIINICSEYHITNYRLNNEIN